MNYFRPQRFNFLPPVVKNLLIINGLMFLATLVFEMNFGIDLIRILGLYYPGSQFFQPFQLVTHAFMHGGFMHIFSNMFALWMFGSMLENIWGPKRFLSYYFITAFGAAAIHLGFNAFEMHRLTTAINEFILGQDIRQFSDFIDNWVPGRFMGSFKSVLSNWERDPENKVYAAQGLQLMEQLRDIKMDIPTVGASGAVFGVLLAFGVFFPNMMLYIYFLFPVKAKYFVIFYGLFELYLGFSRNPDTSIAHFAHLGGMLVGFILIKFWQKKRGHFY